MKVAMTNIGTTFAYSAFPQYLQCFRESESAIYSSDAADTAEMNILRLADVMNSRIMSVILKPGNVKCYFSPLS